MYKKLTLRRMPPETRAIARLLNQLEITVNRLHNRLEKISMLEGDSEALYRRNSQYNEDELFRKVIKEPQDDSLF